MRKGRCDEWYKLLAFSIKFNRNLDIIKILLNCGADTEYANKDGKIPLIESLESSTENNNINLSEIFKLFYPKANPVLTEFV